MRALLYFICCVLIITSCKKEFYKNDDSHVNLGNILTFDQAKEHLKQKLKKIKINKAPYNKANVNLILENVPDSILDNFYWDYATIEENINGYPAILVPIKMTTTIDYSLIDSMNNKGYRVAVFQHNMTKDDILISYRDYHPDHNLVLSKMNTYNIMVYPDNFLTFHYLLGDEVTGYITFLDFELQPTRIGKVVNNKIVEYVNLPFLDSELVNVLLDEPDPINLSINLCEQIQIAYPDFEIDYIKTTTGYYNNEPFVTTGSLNTGLTTYGFNLNIKTSYIAKYNTIWKTEAINIGGDCSSSSNTIISNGVSYFGKNLGNNVFNNEICKILKNILRHFDKIKNSGVILNNHKNYEGKSIEAGYSFYKDDLKSNIYKQSSLNLGSEKEVRLDRSFNPNYGFHSIFVHYHTSSLPFSFKDIIFPLPAYNSISNSPLSVSEKTFYRQEYINNFISFAETNIGDYYIFTIKDINLLNQIFAQKSVDDWMSYEDKLRSKLVSEKKMEDYKAAESLLLETFRGTIDLFKAIKNTDGSFSINKLHILPPSANSTQSIVDYIQLNCNN